MSANEPPDPIMLAISENLQSDQLESYLNRGRQLKHTPTEELERRWAELMREWVKNYTGFDHRERIDIQSELELRGTEPPFHLVEDVVCSLEQQRQQVANELQNLDPDRKAAIEELFRNEIAHLRKKH
jgi:hypothetical protein